MTRNSHRVIYTSSYDRGLQHLLEMWPDVKKKVPEAELHIFYGWQLFDRFYKDNPSSMAWKKNMVQMMQYDGITDHGRVPQPELIKEIEKSGIWAYPTHFGEINCIGALKSQAYGAIPVVIDYAALETSVQFGIKVEGDIYDQETKTSFKNALIWALQHPEWQEEVRKPMMKWASEKFGWANIASQWNSEFKGEKTPDFWEKPTNSILKVWKGGKNG